MPVSESMPAAPVAHDPIASLRERVAAVAEPVADHRVLAFGLPIIDDRLAAGGLAVGGLHEIAGAATALWKVRGLGEAPMPLFAAAEERASGFSAEGFEPEVALRPLTDGREVVEDYRSLQLSLRARCRSYGTNWRGRA